jgi:predicted DNA binding CopG/RHH family protein
MSMQDLEEQAVDVARKKKTERLELRVEADWLERVERQAARMGVSVAAYIRLRVTPGLEADEASEPKEKEGGEG